MTRFARAEGSKACNKKKKEDATPWVEMKDHIKKSKQNKKLIDCVSYKNYISNHYIEIEKESKQNDKSVKIKERNFFFRKHNNDGAVTVSIIAKKLVERQSREDAIPPTNLNESYIKKNGPLISATVSSDLTFFENMKANKKKNNEFIIENNIKYKIFKNTNKKKVWFDLPYEENEYMTKYNKKYIKKEHVKNMEHYKQELLDDGLDMKLIAKKMFKKVDKFHRILRIELLRSEINKANEKNNEPLKLRDTLKNTLQIDTSTISKDFSTSAKKLCEFDVKFKSDSNFEENDLMTCYDGYWIFKENLQSLKIISDKKFHQILSNRTDVNEDINLTQDEKITFRRLMKKEKRRENRLLILYLDENISLRKKRNVVNAENYMEISTEKMVQFDGYWMKKSTAFRLNTLKENLVKEDCSEEEITKILRTERRKEERIFKNENKQSCFKCRKTGHKISSCPEIYGTDANSVPIDICFKCGSTEHMARNCNNNNDTFTHAVCFVCNEIGHISRECPDNPKGLFPNGGSCRKCGSVEHLQKDCRFGSIKKGEESLKASIYDSNACTDSIDGELKIEAKDLQIQKKKQKVVKF